MSTNSSPADTRFASTPEVVLHVAKWLNAECRASTVVAMSVACQDWHEILREYVEVCKVPYVYATLDEWTGMREAHRKIVRIMTMVPKEKSYYGRHDDCVALRVLQLDFRGHQPSEGDLEDHARELPNLKELRVFATVFPKNEDPIAACVIPASHTLPVLESLFVRYDYPYGQLIHAVALDSDLPGPEDSILARAMTIFLQEVGDIIEDHKHTRSRYFRLAFIKPVNEYSVHPGLAFQPIVPEVQTTVEMRVESEFDEHGIAGQGMSTRHTMTRITGLPVYASDEGLDFTDFKRFITPTLGHTQNKDQRLRIQFHCQSDEPVESNILRRALPSVSDFRAILEEIVNGVELDPAAEIRRVESIEVRCFVEFYCHGRSGDEIFSWGAVLDPTLGMESTRGWGSGFNEDWMRTHQKGKCNPKYQSGPFWKSPPYYCEPQFAAGMGALSAFILEQEEAPERANRVLQWAEAMEFWLGPDYQ